MKTATGFGVLTVLVAAAFGCGNESERAYEYFPDMVRGPAYKAFAPNPVTRDGLTLQRPVAGTIPRGYQPFHYGPGEAEAERAGRELQNPHAASPETLEKGKALYQIYCVICHGEQGKGDGPIATKIPSPPSYLSDRVLAFAPGRIFHVITMGAGKMPSYAAQLNADERWEVVAYVKRSLQGISETAVAPAAPSDPMRDAPKADAPKGDEPKADKPKADAPKGDEPKADKPKADAPKGDAPKADAPKPNGPKGDDP